MNQRIAALFQTLGVHQVVDITDARDISLLECGEEFTQALQTKSPQAAHGVSPILSSSCPGWICYAEKVGTFFNNHTTNFRWKVLKVTMLLLLL